jgi:hypothetical protein
MGMEETKRVELCGLRDDFINYLEGHTGIYHQFHKFPTADLIKLGNCVLGEKTMQKLGDKWNWSKFWPKEN